MYLKRVLLVTIVALLFFIGCDESNSSTPTYPSLSLSEVDIEAGKTVTITSNESVTWKIRDQNIASITTSSSTSATIKWGIEGSTILTATNDEGNETIISVIALHPVLGKWKARDTTSDYIDWVDYIYVSDIYKQTSYEGQFIFYTYNSLLTSRVNYDNLTPSSNFIPSGTNFNGTYTSVYSEDYSNGSWVNHVDTDITDDFIISYDYSDLTMDGIGYDRE